MFRWSSAIVGDDGDRSEVRCRGSGLDDQRMLGDHGRSTLVDFPIDSVVSIQSGTMIVE
jgi:hypothetical protein